jgi:site-specific recombinase XerD
LKIQDYDSVQSWLTKLKKKSDSPNTRKTYLTALRQFCEYAGMTPDELITEKKQTRGFEPEDRLDRWFGELTEKKLTRNTCVTKYNAIRSFYKKATRKTELQMDDAPSSWTEREDPPLTREDLGRLYEAARRPMHKAYILCQAQSGLGVSDLLRVPLEEVAKQVESGQDYVHLRMLRGKEKQLGFFDTFFGTMAVEAIKEYVMQKELEDVLFPCTSRNVRDFLQRLSNKADFECAVHSHRLRKFFLTNLKMAGLNETLVEYWMGHKLGKVRSAYFKPPMDEQLRLYKQAEKRLEPIFENS